MALAWLLTTRGIPQLYYGNEIATAGFTTPSDGHVRLDFEGGWKGDAHNKFQASGRNSTENEIYEYVKKLANFRKNSAAITSGSYKQYLPVDGVFVFFRTKGKQTIMTIMHTGKEKQTLQMNRFAESIIGKRIMKNIITGEEIALAATLELQPGSTLVAELK
jgi:glycosidase